MLRALFLDLDNTIYPVHSIGDDLFAELFRMIRESGELGERMDKAEKEIMRRPFQWVVKEFGFSEALAKKCLEHLQHLEFRGPIEPFPDFGILRDIEADRFLVTTGFHRLQNSKVDGMGLRDVFMEVHILDPQTSTLTKKEIFLDILQRHGYARQDVLVIGDDPDSELKAARELGLPRVMFDALGLYPGAAIRRITHYAQLKELIKDF